MHLKYVKSVFEGSYLQVCVRQSFIDAPRGLGRIYVYIHTPIYSVNIKETCRNVTYVQDNVKLEIGSYTRDIFRWEC